MQAVELKYKRQVHLSRSFGQSNQLDGIGPNGQWDDSYVGAWNEVFLHKGGNSKSLIGRCALILGIKMLF